jgi:hypothetical protein
MYKCGVDFTAGIPAKNIEKFAASAMYSSRSDCCLPWGSIQKALFHDKQSISYPLGPVFGILQQQ